MAPLPLPPGPVSNGEYVPGPPQAGDQTILKEIRRSIDHAVAAVGRDRRRFMQTAGGVAASLAMCNLAACSKTTPHASGPPGATAPAATFTQLGIR